MMLPSFRKAGLQQDFALKCDALEGLLRAAQTSPYWAVPVPVLALAAASAASSSVTFA
jgi:hypothetical protein